MSENGTTPVLQEAIQIDPQRLTMIYQQQVIQMTLENAVKTAAIGQLQDELAMLQARVSEYAAMESARQTPDSSSKS
jgi:urease accessory protein UreF